jgi:hypothetical protein
MDCDNASGSDTDATRIVTPPWLANTLLEVFYNTYEVEEIQGDLHELFERRVNESGFP